MVCMAVESWSDPSILIPTLAGLAGAIIGGGCSILAATRQVRIQAEQQKRERHEAIARQLNGFRIAIRNVKHPRHCTDIAIPLRRFFLDNPECLVSNEEFFVDYLAPLTDSIRPADEYWTDTRILGFTVDGGSLHF